MSKLIILHVFALLSIVIANNLNIKRNNQRILFNPEKELRLWNAAGSGNSFDVQNLLSSGTNPNWVNPHKEQMAALHQAARFNKVGVAKDLLDHGALVNLQDIRNRTPLAEAAFYGSTDVMHILLKWGADINMATGNGNSPLMRTIYGGHISSAEVLINAHVNLEYEDHENKTALHWAAQFNKTTMAQMLLQAGANPNQHGYKGLTPEAYARLLGNIYMADIIANYTRSPTQITSVTSTLPHPLGTANNIKPLIKWSTDHPVITTATPKIRIVNSNEKPIVTSKTAELFISSPPDLHVTSAAIDSSVPIIVGSVISTVLLIGLLAVVFIYIKNRNNTNREEHGLGDLQQSQQTEVSMGSRHDSVNSLYDRVETEVPDHDSHNESENNNSGAIVTKEKIEFNFI